MPEGETETEVVERTAENPFVGRFEAFFRAKYKKEIERLVESYPEKRSLFVDFKELQETIQQILFLHPGRIQQTGLSNRESSLQTPTHHSRREKILLLLL